MLGQAVFHSGGGGEGGGDIAETHIGGVEAWRLILCRYHKPEGVRDAGAEGRVLGRSTNFIAPSDNLLDERLRRRESHATRARKARVRVARDRNCRLDQGLHLHWFHAEAR